LNRWWQEQRAGSTVSVALRKALEIAWEFMRGSFPDRRRQRYGDLEYDWEHRVDTTSATVGWRTRLLGLLNSPYQPIPPEQFREMMASLAIDFPRFTLIDIGSGKGRAVLLATEFGFRRIIGVELLSELDAIARENVRKFSAREPKVNIELVCLDAADFDFPDEPTVIFLFNPLSACGLRKLMENLDASLQKKSCETYVLYTNPVLESIVAKSPSLTRIVHARGYSLFRNSTES
jgi:SAM-dependent methyltransferase